MNTLTISEVEARGLAQVNNRRTYVNRINQPEIVPTFSVEVGSSLNPKFVAVAAFAVMVVVMVATSVAFRGGLAWDATTAVESLKAILGGR